MPAAKKLVDALEVSSSEEVCLYGNKIHLLSHMVYGDHHKIEKQICAALEADYAKELESAVKKREINAINKKIDNVSDTVNNKDTCYTFREIERYMGDILLDAFKEKAVSIFSLIGVLTESCQKLFDKKLPLKSDERNRSIIKAYFDAWNDFRDIFSMVVRKKDEDIESDFYDVYKENWDLVRSTYRAENLCRNYITKGVGDNLTSNQAFFGSALRGTSAWKKPDKKFDTSQHTFLKIDGLIYFFCLPAGSKPTFLEGEDESCMILQQRKMQDPMMNLPRHVFTPARTFFEENPHETVFTIEDNMTDPVYVTRDVFDIYNNGTFKTAARDEIGEDAYKDNLLSVMTVMKDFCLRYTYWQDRTIPFRELSEYDNIGEFYDDIRKVMAVQRWIPGNRQLIEEMTNDGRGLLFELTSKSMRAYKNTGNPDKLNSYAKVLMYIISEKNQTEGNIMLNSRPQLMYRSEAHGKPKKHETGSIMINKRDADGNRIPDDVISELFQYYNDFSDAAPMSTEAKRLIREKGVTIRKAEHEFIRDKRFYKEQFKIALSYKKNSNCDNIGPSLNARVKEAAPEMNRIVIIRNMQDILYMLVLDPDGNELEKRSLNIINGIDYHKRLKEAENKKREKSAKEWDNSGKIRDLRESYFNKAITEIVNAVIEYDAIVLLEKIAEQTKDKYYALGNTAFKRFEDKLCARLGDLFFKHIPEGEPGSLSNPYQFCYDGNLSEWQNGIVFFVPAFGTSDTDYDSGFRCEFDTSNIQTKRAKMSFLSKFDLIRYNAETCGLEISFDYNNFNTSKSKAKKAKKEEDKERQTKWHMVLTEGVVSYDRENKCNVYDEKPFVSLPKLLKEIGLPKDAELQQYALDGVLSGKAVDLVFFNMLKLLRGRRGGCNGERAMYVSPVTSRQVDLSENTALNLNKKFIKMKEEAKE